MKKWTVVFLSIALMATSGCDSNKESDSEEGSQSGGEAAAADESAVDEIGEGLEPGGYEIEVTGDVEQLGEYEGNNDSPYTFRPGSEGTNDEGPYILRVRTHTERDGDEIGAYALISLPAGTEPGTYELKANQKADDDEAYAMFRAEAQEWVIAREVSGEVTVGEIGDEVTIAFDFEAADGDDKGVEVNGRVFKIPFEYSTSVRADATIDGEDDEFRSARVHYVDNDDAYSVSVGPLSNMFIFSLPADVESGSYDLVLDGDEEGIELSRDTSYDEFEGTIDIEREGQFAHGEFDFAASGPDEEAELSGRFDYVDLKDDE